jgi:hypothetical protein
MDQEDNGGVFGDQHGDVKQIMIDVKDIRTHRTFVDLLRIEPGMLQEIIQSMRVHGFFESQPIVCAVWPGQEQPVLADGNTRVQAAQAVGVSDLRQSRRLEFVNRSKRLKSVGHLKVAPSQTCSVDRAFGPLVPVS